MPFISYAQNNEDVMLWRALRDQGPGFYVDVGAAHPDTDSVTRAFYDRGWRGLNIEAVPAMARRIADARPRDVTLAVAAGATDGAIELHVVEDTGLSTTDGATAAMLDHSGFVSRPVRVPVRRLAALLSEHAPPDIHFLKIDVEGAERAVIEGADLGLHRPRIVLIEATRPMSTEPSHAAWEGLVLAAGYQFAFFDGLNRFYVAAEWVETLAPRLAVPVNVLDDYVRVSDAASANQAAEQRAELARAVALARIADDGARAAYARAFEQARDLGTLRERVGHIERARDDAVRSHQASEAHLLAQIGRADRAEAAIRDHEAAHRATQEERAEIRRQLAAVHGSTSWRVTAPLRAVVGVVRGAGADASPGPQPALQPASQPVRPPVPSPEPVRQPLPPQDTAPEARPLRRTIHQFHSGSATGDAVTNAMLLIRAHLRSLGYRSDIFVQHRDPELAHTLRLLDEMPQGADQVLIVHHSMGHDALDRILAHPAPKVLYYHNITPAEFLPPNPVIQHYAALGREQLLALRTATRAALAASEFNAVELRRARFDPVRACPLLFDLDALRRRRQPPPADPARPYTVLFVGRVIESKAQADLVDAFAVFRTALGRPARLVLVGRTDSPGTYLQTLDDRMRRHGLEAELVVTGPLSDAALDAQYAAADLYVSLSHHEGFGVPLVEAAALGLPVLAWPCGAVPYTLGGQLGLLDAREPEAVAARMLAIARDPAARAALMAEQQAALDRFALPHHWPALHEALALAGAAPPPDPATRAALAARIGFAITGHTKGSYSLAAVNRDLVAGIAAERPNRARLIPVEGPAEPDVTPAAVPEVVVSQHYPILVPDHRGDLTLALVFWEESLLPAATIDTLSAGFDGVLAPSPFVAKALIDSGLSIPCMVIGQAPALGPFEALAQERGGRRATEPLTLLHVSSCFPRKGVDVLLAAYVRAFRAADAVRLVIKGFPNPHNTVPEQVAALRAADPDAPAIEVIDADLDSAAMLDLYRRADAMVLPTRGEGLNLPAAEAMAAGVPLIVTGYGGHMSFCGPDTARLLEYRLGPSGSHVATPHSLWAEPSVDDLVAALHERWRAWDDARAAAALTERTARARRTVARALDRSGMVGRLEAASLDLLLRPPPRPIRVAWITSWGVRCGIAEYTRQLIDALPPHPAIEGHVVLSDDRTAAAAEPGTPMPGTPMPGTPTPGTPTRPAWQLGGDEGPRRPAGAIVATGADVVVIQHQPGLLSWASLVNWLAAPVLRERVVVVTLHNTRTLEESPAADRDAVCQALRGVARVMVHGLEDLNRLHGWGLAAQATLMPHGAREPLSSRPDRDPGAAPLIGCYGFFLPGKGIPQLIEALVGLRRTRPGARLRLVNADYGAGLSSAEIALCRALADGFGLSDAIEWETRFLPDEDSLALLVDCDVIVIPTQTSLESSSAAVRTALAAGPPVLVTPLPQFADVEPAVERSAGLAPADLLAGLERLLSDPAKRDAVRRASKAWSDANQWSAVGARFQGMLVGLCCIAPS